MDLFNVPIDQLRENFVRNRLAEEQHFGLGGENIEDKVRQECEAASPDTPFWVDAFVCLLNSEFPNCFFDAFGETEDGTKIVVEYGEPNANLPPGLDCTSGFPLVRLLQSLEWPLLNISKWTPNCSLTF